VAICELEARGFQSFFFEVFFLGHDPRRIWLSSYVSCQPLLAETAGLRGI